MSGKTDRLLDAILLLGAVAGILICTMLSASVLTGTGAAACSILILLFWLLGAVLLIRRPLFGQFRCTVCAAIGLYLCLCLRLSLFNYISPDYVSFLSQWTETMRGMTVREVLLTPIGDYNVPYLYLLLLISRLKMYDLYAIKLVSVVADLFLAIAVGRLAALVTRRNGVILAAFFGALLAPTCFLNSAYWGQCDSIYAAFCLWGLYYGLKKRPVLSMVMLAFALGFKLQAIFILPIIAFLLVKRLVSLRHLPAFPIAFFVLMLPVLLAGRSFADTFSIYLDQTGSYPYLSLNAPSFWSLIPNDYFSSLSPLPVLLAGIVTLLLLYAFLPRCRNMSDGSMIAAALIFTLAIPWLLPRMHERYFYLAEMLSVVYAARYPRRLAVPCILLGGGFLSYCLYLFGGMHILSLELVAASYGVLLVYLTAALLRDTAAEAAALPERKSGDALPGGKSGNAPAPKP